MTHIVPGPESVIGELGKRIADIILIAYDGLPETFEQNIIFGTESNTWIRRIQSAKVGQCIYNTS